MGCPNDFLMTEIQVTLPMFSEIRDWNQIKALHIGPGHVLSLDQVPITLFFLNKTESTYFLTEIPGRQPDHEHNPNIPHTCVPPATQRLRYNKTQK